MVPPPTQPTLFVVFSRGFQSSISGGDNKERERDERAVGKGESIDGQNLIAPSRIPSSIEPARGKKLGSCRIGLFSDPSLAREQESSRRRCL